MCGCATVSDAVVSLESQQAGAREDPSALPGRLAPAR